MRIAQELFHGVVPRVAPQRLPESNAQDATNARLLSGDLEAWRQFAAVQTLATPAPVRSIYKLHDAWLSWGGDVDAARGPVPGDTTFRLYLTGPSIYSTPRFTNYSMATNSGAVAFPTITRPLGVVAPIQHPIVLHTYASGVESSYLTQYVYTNVNDLGNESAPSAPNGISVPTPTGDGDSNLVTNMILEDPGTNTYTIRTARVYRAATGATGTEYRFVAEVNYNLGTGIATYIDSLSDAALGAVLPSELWDLPPNDLQNMLALPNGVMAGFSKNRLCLSAQNFPHAWPVGNRYTTDTDIVGIGNIDTTVVVFTKSFLYVATGSDPASYSMAKFEVPYAGVSKRSIAYLDGLGVVGATPDGLRAVAGVGQSVNITRALFTRQQWRALHPSSILGVAHDNIYFMFYDIGTSDGKGGYAIDGSPGGFGMVPLGFHASAAYNDPETGELCLVLDAMDEPRSVLLPLASTAPAVDGATIFGFDSTDGNGNLVYRYRGKLNLLDVPAAFSAAQMRADLTNVVWRIYGDNVLVFEQAMSQGGEFVLPNFTDTYTRLEFEIIGTSRVRVVQAAEDMGELK